MRLGARHYSKRNSALPERSGPPIFLTVGRIGALLVRRAIVFACIVAAPVVARADGANPAPSDACAPPPASSSPAEPAPAPPSGDDPFPVPESLRPGVEFWKKVWGVWTLGQVVFHDNVNHALVYEIADLPGTPGESYTDEQQRFVKARREAWERRLRELERKVAAGEPLDDEEKALALSVTEAAGADALHGAASRVRAQRGLRERFLRGLAISGRYHRAFTEAFREEGLPEDLAYLPHVESSFQVQARSSAGAVGVWQFTRAAARVFMKVAPGIDERLDPVAAARGAARYLRRAYDELGDWALAVTSYNHGIDGMQAAKARFGTDFPRIVREYDGRTFGFASRNFYMEFLAAREVAKNPTPYFPEGVAFERPLAHDRFTLTRSSTPASLSQAFGVPVATLVPMNPAWTSRAVRGKATLPPGTVVWLPEGTLERIAAASRPARHIVAAAPQAAPAKAAPAKASPGSHGGMGDFVVHVVRRGESLMAIAARYGVRVSDLVGLNQLADAHLIVPGQRIRVPVSAR